MTDQDARDLIARAREIGRPLRADKNDRVRLAGWLLGALADQLERDSARLAEVRAVFDAFDWERDDRQYALEQIEMIVATEKPAPDSIPR